MLNFSQLVSLLFSPACCFGSQVRYQRTLTALLAAAHALTAMYNKLTQHY